MEVKLLVIIILTILIFSTILIVFLGLIFPERFAIVAKEICLLTVAKILANPKVCEVFMI
ncbi:MAG: hypothetical protein QXQ14_00125 [Candidatus Aenigmatarchaeota archaeon]